MRLTSALAAASVLVLSAVNPTLASIFPPTELVAAHGLPAPTNPPGAQALIDWTQNAIVSFFPNHSTWEQGFDASMDPSLTSTFGINGQNDYLTVYNFDSFKQLYAGLYQFLGSKLRTHVLQFTDAVAYPFSDDPTSGYVYSTTIEYGTYLNGTKATPAREASFATVRNCNGQRRITEIRKVSDFVVG